MSDPISGVLRSQYQTAHGTLEGTMAGVSAAQAHWAPPGKAMPIAAHYAHVIAAETSSTMCWSRVAHRSR